ncbi:sporulation inhibitor of replication protein SirA [Bacillus timonensis]|nr:sporulation inhibitor of replication protein SirA [Bacillus timonensis]
MRYYYLYLVDEEIANHYFGREYKIYQLFSEYQKKISNDNVLRKQIDYITKPIPSLRLHQFLDQNLERFNNNLIENNIYRHKSKTDNSEAKLTIFDTYIILEAVGGYEAETTFFEVLRRFDKCFIAMEFHTNRYGWLNPIKERKFI